MSKQNKKNKKAAGNAEAQDPQANANQAQNSSSQTAPQQVPGRTVGFVIMSVLIICVAIFMQFESQEMGSDTVEAAYAGELTGFNSSLFYLPDDDMAGFVPIPAGSFTMGSNPALDRMAYENERWSRIQRQGEPTLPLYYIARFETTRAQFAQFVADTGMGEQAMADSDSLPGDLPVTQVNWPEALAYTRWLDEQLRNSPDTPAEIREFLNSGAKVTLPNEAEWEKAARSDDGRIFPWGSRPRNNLANIGNDTLVPVGSIPCDECAYGLSDMAGNVWELTRSPLKDYPFSPTLDTENLQAEPLFVMRGGAYSDQLNNVRAAVRGAADPGVRNGTIGFRVVISTE